MRLKGQKAAAERFPFCLEDGVMHNPRLIPCWLFVLFAVISVTPPASAGEKTDTVILKNGNLPEDREQPIEASFRRC